MCYYHCNRQCMNDVMRSVYAMIIGMDEMCSRQSFVQVILCCLGQIARVIESRIYTHNLQAKAMLITQLENVNLMFRNRLVPGHVENYSSKINKRNIVEFKLNLADFEVQQNVLISVQMQTNKFTKFTSKDNVSTAFDLNHTPHSRQKVKLL